MTKVIQVIQYFDCRYGRSFAEATEYFERSEKTMRRYLEKIEHEYPGLSIERIYGADKVSRYRIVARSGLRSSVSSHDLLELHALRSAEKTAKFSGREDVADKLHNLYERLTRHLPRATRIALEEELAVLAKSEHASPPAPLNAFSPGGPARQAVLDRLRLAITTCRIVRLVVSGDILVAAVTGIQYTQGADARVDLRTSQGEMAVSLSGIEDVVGIDDLFLGPLAA
jgi:hypothetical protein